MKTPKLNPCSSPKHWGHLLFLLISGGVGCGSSVSLTLVGPERPLLAVVGQDLVLPCSFHPSDDTQQLTVVWYRISGNTQTHIHVHSDGTNHNEDQSHDYRGRTSLFLNEISTGNVSLKLSGIRLSDVGRYQCTVVTRDRNHDNADMEVQVKVIGTLPMIFTDQRGRTQLNLRCVSSGWSPQPVIDWLDAQGCSLPAEPTESHQEANGTFRVERRLLVDWKTNNSNSSYHCRVTLGDVVKTTQRNVTDEDKEGKLEPRKFDLYIIFTIVGGVLATVVTMVMWLRGRKIQRHASSTGDVIMRGPVITG